MFLSPAVSLSGAVDYAMYASFRQKLIQAPSDGLVVVELSTLGGDPEVARMMGEDVRYHSAINSGRRFVFLGKAAIYSAGTTFMMTESIASEAEPCRGQLRYFGVGLDRKFYMTGRRYPACPLTTCRAVMRCDFYVKRNSLGAIR